MRLSANSYKMAVLTLALLAIFIPSKLIVQNVDAKTNTLDVTNNNLNAQTTTNHIKITLISALANRQYDNIRLYISELPNFGTPDNNDGKIGIDLNDAFTNKATYHTKINVPISEIQEFKIFHVCIDGIPVDPSSANVQIKCFKTTLNEQTNTEIIKIKV